MKPIEPCKYKVGQLWKTRGGWIARVIWLQPVWWSNRCMYVVHQPGVDLEVGPISHDVRDGTAGVAASGLKLPPTYDGHPADLVELLEDVP